MAIEFNCPHCQKHLKIKDEMAGKKGPCPGCKKIVVVPTPSTATAAASKAVPAGKPASAAKPAPGAKPAAPTPAPDPIDAEAIANSVFADEPQPPEEVAEPQTITFDCPMCGEKVTMSTELCGKQAPCPNPECRRIIKVPMLQKAEKKDWRSTKKNLPSGDRRNFEPGPDDVWGGQAEQVGTRTLQEAGVLPVEKERLTRAQWAFRITLVVIPTALLGFGLWTLFALAAQNAQHNLAMQARKLVTEQGESKLSPMARGEVHRALGEYYVHSGRRDTVDQAQQEFRAARGSIVSAPPSNERDLLLASLALAQTGLGGDQAEVDAGLRVKWEDPALRKELRETLLAISSLDGKVNAAREVSRELMEHGPAATELASGLTVQLIATNDDLRPEAHGLAGLELFRKGDKAAAAKKRDEGVACFAAPKGAKDWKRPAVSPSLVALVAALGKEDSLGQIGDVKDPVLLQGYAEGLALRGEIQRAQELAKTLPAVFRIRALVAVARIDPGTVPMAFDEAEKEKLDSWTAFRLVRLGVKANLGDRASRLAGGIVDPGLKAWAQLEIFRATLAAAGDKVADTAADDVIDKSSAAYLVAREAIARHNMSHGDSALKNRVKTWEEPLRPFGYAGAALGYRKAD